MNSKELAILSDILKSVDLLRSGGISLSTETEIKNDTGNPLPVDMTKVGGAAIALGQAAMAASLPVTIANNQSAVPVLDTNSAAMAASLSIIDDWDESDRAKVNPIVGQAGVAANAGAVDALTQRMILASDDPAVAALQIMDDWDNNDAAKTVGVTVTVETTITRPSDTTTYAANDVICNSDSAPVIQTITGCSRYNLGSGTIIDAVLIGGGNETLKLDADLFLFDTTVTMDNDNSPFTPTDTEFGTCVGVITFLGGTARSGTAGTGGNCFYPNAIDGKPIVFTTVTTTTLYGILVARNAYIPISGETFKIRMKILQD